MSALFERPNALLSVSRSLFEITESSSRSAYVWSPIAILLHYAKNLFQSIYLDSPTSGKREKSCCLVTISYRAQIVFCLAMNLKNALFSIEYCGT